MKDRLNSLYRHSPRLEVLVFDEDKQEELSVPDEFLLNVLVQRQEVISLRQAVDRVSQLHRLLSAALDTSGPDVGSLNEMIKTLDGEFQEVDERSAGICSAINELKATMLKGGGGGADDRIRKDQLAGLTESLRRVLIKFNGDYVEYQEASRQKAVDYSKKRASIASEEERLLDFFGDDYRSKEARPQLKRSISTYHEVLQEISERKETIAHVENAIEELGKLFQELRIYIDTGSNLTDQIERNIELTGEYVENSLIETGKTVQTRENIRKGRGCMGKSLMVLRYGLILLLALLIFFFIVVIMRLL